MIRNTLLLVFLLHFSALAQKEYFIYADPATCSFKKIAHIPGVNWVRVGCHAYDAYHKKYFFLGSVDTKRWNLYVINALDGGVAYVNELTSILQAGDNLANIEYDALTDRLYGLLWRSADRKEYFVSIDYRTGQITNIREIPGVELVRSQCAFIDKREGAYCFLGKSFADTGAYLITMKLTDGKELKRLAISAAIYCLEYDSLLNKVFTVRQYHTAQLQYVSEIDQNTGTILDKFLVQGLPHIVDGYATYDTRKHNLTFRPSSGSQSKLLTINTVTGAIINDPEFIRLRDIMDNLLFLEYDPDMETLVGIHWESSFRPEQEQVVLYPLPFNDKLNIAFSVFHQALVIETFDQQGKWLRTDRYENAGNIIYHRDALASGIYYLRIRSFAGLIGNYKIVIL